MDKDIDNEALLERIKVLERAALVCKGMEAALQESNERYEKLLAAVTDYTFTVIVDQGRAVATSHSANCVAVTGYTSEEYETNPYLWYDMIYGEDRKAVLEQAAKVLAGEDVAALEHRIVHKDGSVRWVLNTPVPRHNQRGELVAYDGLVRDISRRKNVEMEKERLIAELQLALSKVKALSGLLPICASCKKIRDDKGYWQQIEAYIQDHSEAEFSHGICPECGKRLYPDLWRD